jgi:hypothetical protein
MLALKWLTFDLSFNNNFIHVVKKRTANDTIAADTFGGSYSSSTPLPHFHYYH